MKEEENYYSDSKGTKRWWHKKGDRSQLHREDGPAFERANGHREWYTNGKLHREDGPAVEKADGTNEWYINDKLDRADGPAIERTDGSRLWYTNGKLHREDGPAVEYTNRFRLWYINGMRLHILTKEHLIKYMETYNLTVAHLLTDSDEVVRTSAAKYDWNE